MDVKSMLKKRGVIIGLVVLFLLLFLVLSRSNSPFVPGRLSPTPIAFPTTFDTSTGPLGQLTDTELRYPEGIPQEFRHADETEDFGVLVVTSEPSEARVIIDSSEHGFAEEKTDIQVQQTPFKILRVPVGEHEIVTLKRGFNPAEHKFIIEKDRVTRIHQILTPF